MFVRLIGKLDDPRALEALERLAGVQAEFAVFAAAELARRGKPERFLELLRTADPIDPTDALAFEVLPEVARTRWLAAFRAGDPERPPLDLDPQSRDELEFFWGVRIPDEILDRLAAGVLASKAPLEQVLEFFVRTHPDAFVGDALAKIAEELAESVPPTDEDWYHNSCRRALGYLEVRAPERLAAVLAAWKPILPSEQYALLTGRGGIDEPGVPPFPETRRSRWAETARLAARGEPEARAEWLGLVRDARMFVLYELDEGAACLWGDPELVPTWIDRLDAPCCVSLHAIFALKTAFPTLESADFAWACPIVKRRIAAWYEKYRGRFRMSRILGGLVPL